MDMTIKIRNLVAKQNGAGQVALKQWKAANDAATDSAVPAWKSTQVEELLRSHTPERLNALIFEHFILHDVWLCLDRRHLQFKFEPVQSYAFIFQ